MQGDEGARPLEADGVDSRRGESGGSARGFEHDRLADRRKPDAYWTAGTVDTRRGAWVLGTKAVGEPERLPRLVGAQEDPAVGVAGALSGSPGVRSGEATSDRLLHRDDRHTAGPGLEPSAVAEQTGDPVDRAVICVFLLVGATVSRHYLADGLLRSVGELAPTEQAPESTEPDQMAQRPFDLDGGKPRSPA